MATRAHAHLPARLDPNAGRIAVVLSLLATMLTFGGASAPAEAATPFTTVFTANAPGNIAFVSNTLITCSTSSGANASRCVSLGQNGNWANNNFTMIEVDVDSDPTTSNSSTNALSLSATSEVLFAGLFWVGRSSSNNVFDPNIKIDTPEAGGYVDVTAEHIDNLGTRHYGAYADVTALVQAGGSGNYTVGGADLAASGLHNYGGWTLAVAYQDNSEPWRNLTIFNGFDFVDRSNGYNVPLTVSGFTAPPVGPVNAQIGVQTGEGDARYSGPSTSVNGTRVFDAMNPVNNTQNSTISVLGNAANTAGNPSYRNQLGFDADIMDATGLIPPDATSAVLGFRSTGDVYGINLISTAIEIYVPNLTRSLSKTAIDLNGEQVHPGDVIEYRVAFENDGDDPAIDVVLTDAIPTGTTYVPNSLQEVQGAGILGSKTDTFGDDSAFYDASNDKVVFHLGSGATASDGGQVDPLSSGGQAHEVAFRVTVDAGTEGIELTNAAAIDYVAKFVNERYQAVSDPVIDPVEALVDLSISKSDDGDPVTAGDEITYTLSVSNAGPSTADNVVITDTLPAGVSFAASADCTDSAGTVSCALGNVVPGGTASTTITVNVDGAFIGTSLTNIASVTSDTHEHDLSDNATKEATLVDREIDLVLAKSAPATVHAGDQLTYTLTVENLGDSDALNVSLTDPLPAGVVFVSADADRGGTCSSAIICSWPSLGAGATSTVSIAVAVPAGAVDGTVISNSATVTSTDVEPTPANNAAAVNTRVVSEADVAISKTGPATVLAGKQVTYVLDVENSGPSNSDEVIVTDEVPSAEYTFNAAASSSGCAEAGNSITCAAGTLTPGGTASYVLVFDVDADASHATLVNNEASVATATTDPVTSNNVSDVDTMINREADLSIIKDDNTAIAVAGSQIGYTLDYANAGPSDASNVVVLDTLPAGVTFNASLSPGCSISGTALSCPVGSLAAGAASSFTVVVDVDPTLPDGLALPNTSSIYGSETDPVAANDTSRVTTPSKRSSELQITKTDNIDPVLAGNQLTYTLEVTNVGPSADDNITVIDTLPSGLTFVAASVGCAHAGGEVTCAAGTLLPGEDAVFTITVDTDPALGTGTVLLNNATAEGDLSPRVEVEEETTVVTVADLSITKTGPTTVTAGTSMTYTLSVRNAGPSDAANVIVTDAFPSGTIFSSHTVIAGSGTCNYTLANITCTQATVAPLGTFVVEVVLDVGPAVTDGRTLTNTAFVSSDTPDSNPSNDSDDVGTDVERSADLILNKVALTPTVEAGQAATFTVEVTNAGPSIATDVIISDFLPAGFTFDPAASSLGCRYSIACFVPTTLAVGDSYTFTIVANVGSGVTAGEHTNSADVAGNEADPHAIDNDDDDSVEVTNSADLSIVKTAPDTTFIPGTTHEYEVTVTNNGPSDAVNVVVSDTLPDGLAFNPTGSSPACSSGVVCTAPVVPGGDSVSFTIMVDVDSSVTNAVTNIATVDADTHDPNPSNDTDSDTTPVVPEADLEITKTASATVIAGNTLTYALSLTNNGPSDAQSVEILDTLPPGVVFQSASAGCSESGGVVTCSYPSVANGVSVDQEVTVVVPASIDHGRLLVNDVDVESATFDSDLSNNDDDARTTVSRTANLVLDKTVSSATAVAGSSLTYTIAIHNEGPSNAANLVVADNLPTGMTVLSVASSIGNCLPNGPGISCSLADMAPTDSMVITVAVDIDPSVADGTVLNNQADVSTSTNESDNTDNVDSVAVVVNAAAGLSVTKTSDVSDVAAGNELTYTIAVSNAGPSDARNVALTDVVPSSLRVDSISPTTSTSPAAECSDASNVVTCELDTLAAGASFTLTIEATVDETTAEGTQVSNTASVTSSTTDPDPTDNAASAVVDVNRSADIAITKTAVDATVSAGELLFYNLAASNAGPSTANNVMVSDVLPSGLVFNPTLSSSSCTETAGTVTCALGSILAEAEVPFVIALDVPSGFADGATIHNEAQIAADEDDPDLLNNSDDDRVLTGNEADLAIVKDATGFVVAGESISWDLGVSNVGPADGLNVMVRDALPVGATFDLDGSDSRCRDAAGVVTCDLGTLADGATDTVTISVDVDAAVAAASLLSNTATIGSDTDDPDPIDNASTDEIPVERASDLSIVKNDLADPVIAGSEVQWAITVVNQGPSDSANTTLVDSMPTGFIATAVDNSEDCSIVSNVVDCDFGTVSAGTSVSIVVTATTDSSFTDGSVHSNTATADGDSSDAVSDTETTTIIRRSDLEIDKTSDGAVVAGTNQRYTIVVDNAGPSVADNVVVTDALPSGTSFVSDSESACSATGSIVTCSLGAIPASVSRNFDIEVAVSDLAADPVVNAAAVDSDSVDPDPDDNTDTDDSDIDYEADLSIEKTASPDPAVPGGNLTWDLVVTNDGPSGATNVTVSDSLPEGTAFVAASPACAEASGVVTCSQAELASGDSVAFQVIASIEPAFDGLIVNTASVASDTRDPDLDNNESTSSTPTEASADLSIDKRLITSPVVAGSGATYELVVTNAGPSTAINVALTDALPPGVTFVSADVGCIEVSAVVTCSTDVLAVGDQRTFAIEVALDASLANEATVSNQGSVRSDTADPNPDNDDDVEDAEIVRQAQLSVNKRLLTDDPVAGRDVVFEMVVTNEGPSDAANVELVDSVDPAFTVIDATSPDCLISGNDVTCSTPTLGAGASWRIEVTATATIGAVGPAANTVAVDSDDSDEATGNVGFSVRAPRSEISIAKSTDDVVSRDGDEVTWAIVVANDGEATAAPLTVTDEIDANQRPVEVDSDDATCVIDGQTIECRVEAGFDGVAEISVVTAVRDIGKPVTNTASVAVDNGTSVLGTQVIASADVQPANSVGILAFTGANLIKAMLLALILVVAGGVMVTVGGWRRDRA